MSYQRVRSVFEIEYPERSEPNKSTIMRLTKKFEETCSVCRCWYHRGKSLLQYAVMRHCVPTKWRRTFRTCFIMYLFPNTLFHMYRLFFVMWVATFVDHPVPAYGFFRSLRIAFQRYIRIFLIITRQHCTGSRRSRIPYSPDLAPRDFWLFPLMKRGMRGTQYRTDEDVKKDVDKFFTQTPSVEFAKIILDLCPERMRRCVENGGSYFEKEPKACRQRRAIVTSNVYVSVSINFVWFFL